MFTLQDGRLYQSRAGVRYRVKYDSDLKRFTCRSYSGTWHVNGVASDIAMHDLIMEVPESRWIPVATDTMVPDQLYRYHRGHLQRMVTRGEAQRLAPNHPSKQSKPQMTNPQVANVDLAMVLFENHWYVRITTPSGATALLPM